jgi:hypothetical protein
MSEKYTLGLTRNRLFSLDNTVVFIGVNKEAFDERECTKALKMLAAKEPVITAAIELNDDASADVVLGKTEPFVAFSEDDALALEKLYDQNGINFSERLFEFTVCGGNTLVIGAHTSVCDCKSLLRLAKLFIGFYNHDSLSVEPSDVLTFPDAKSLPAKLNSPIIDKLSADLESKWKGDGVKFTVDDFMKASKEYSVKKADVGVLTERLSSDEKVSLAKYCSDNELDLSSVVAFGFYDAVYGMVDVPKRARKLSAYSDRRFFLSCAENCSVGPFNGNVDVSLKPKDKKLDDEGRLKAFHLALYKGVTSAFRSFYDELLLMKLPPVYCDASYMSTAGCYSSRAASRLADNYGCNDKRMLGSFSCNLTQKYWLPLTSFEEVRVSEPFVRKFCAMIDIFICDGDVKIVFRYNKAKITDERAVEIAEKAMKMIRSFGK